MDYRIRVTSAARDDIRDYAQYILEREEFSEPAKRWMQGAYEAIARLREMPGKYPPVDEQLGFDLPLKHSHYHSHRVIFAIDEDAKEVVVLRVFHGARQLKPNHLSIAQED